MITAIFVLVTFVFLIIEVPFDVFVNISLDRVLVEYMIESPIKKRGYAYIKNGELFHGIEKKKKQGETSVIDMISKMRKRVIVKELHIRGILGDENVENSIVQSVLFQSVASAVISFVKNNNPQANTSQRYHISAEDDNNIFLEITFWLSVIDLLYLVMWRGIKNAIDNK